MNSSMNVLYLTFIQHRITEPCFPFLCGVNDASHVPHSHLVDSNRVRTRRQLCTTPRENLRPRLHSLQVQATREPVGCVVCQQVLEEQVLHHEVSLQRPIAATKGRWNGMTYQICTKIRSRTSSCNKTIHLHGPIETVREIENRAADSHTCDRRKWVSVRRQRRHAAEDTKPNHNFEEVTAAGR
jgi:hypothetical protein